MKKDMLVEGIVDKIYKLNYLKFINLELDGR